MNEIYFPRAADRATAWANEEGLWLEDGWTVGIPPEVAVRYVAAFDTDPSEGFFRHDGKVVLSHGGAKITLSESEAAAIVQLTCATFGHTRPD
jgi:hypothetical protein